MSVATQRNTQLDTERRNDRLSMRAAREAQNSLETTSPMSAVARTASTRPRPPPGCTPTAPTKWPTTVRHTSWCNCCRRSTTPSSTC